MEKLTQYPASNLSSFVPWPSLVKLADDMDKMNKNNKEENDLFDITKINR